MTGKDLLREDKPLSEWWSNIVRDPKFHQVTALCRADLFSELKGADSVHGAKKAMDLLMDFGTPSDEGSAYPSSGIIHDLSKTVLKTV